MRWMRVTWVLTAAAVAASLAGCGRHSSAEHYYLVASNTRLAYWQSASAGLDKIAAEYNVHADLSGPDTFDPKEQVEDFRAVVAKKPAGILVSVIDPKLMQPEIDAAIEAGIPVLTVDSDAPNSKRLYFIGTNNREAGRLGGRALVQKLHGKGNVVVFTMPGQPNLDDRLAGYKDVLATAPGIQIVEVVDIAGQSTVAFDKTQQDLAKTGKDRIDGFVCLEASAGKEVGEVLRRANLKDRVVIAMDVDKDTLDLVKEGVIAATVAQKPFTMAYVGVKMLDQLHHDPLPSLTKNYAIDPQSPIPSFIDTGSALVDAGNVDQYLQAAQGH
ncbi:MAG TPA: substrate-binding domain-containing protein [Acidobacteriaceae bacterium]|nr:substrate-binding domain-containing protein [Acidobacteriaceae bacterium]